MIAFQTLVCYYFKKDRDPVERLKKGQGSLKKTLKRIGIPYCILVKELPFQGFLRIAVFCLFIFWPGAILHNFGKAFLKSYVLCYWQYDYKRPDRTAVVVENCRFSFLCRIAAHLFIYFLARGNSFTRIQ